MDLKSEPRSRNLFFLYTILEPFWYSQKSTWITHGAVAQSPISGGSSHIDLGNQSTSSQNISYTWEYVSQSGGSGVDVQYGGVTRSPGYVTPTITSSFNANQYKPFTFGSGGNNTTVYFKFTLISATVDVVPSSPNNSANAQTLILL